MSLVVPVLMVALVGLMLLVPPLSFARAVWRYHGGGAELGRRARQVLWTGAALLPMIVNIGNLSLAWEALAAGRLEPDQNMAVAVLISWLAFWGRVAMGKRALRRGRIGSV